MTGVCPRCGEPIYSTLEPRFGSTGWFTSETRWRHEATQRLTCSTATGQVRVRS